MSDNRTLLLIGLLAMATACSKGQDTAAPATPEQAATPVEAEQPAGLAADEAATAEQAAEPQGFGPAPGFTLHSVTGEEVSLADYRGKTVVLEWFNPGCPFVEFAHGEGPLVQQPARAMDQGVVWLAINSNSAGSQGHGAALNKDAAAQWKMTYPVLLDESGEVGRAYGAKTTPHMYVIDPQGNLVYRGALDNAPLGKSEDGEVVNYVDAALQAVRAGQPVETAETRSYGCSVKYSS